MNSKLPAGHVRIVHLEDSANDRELIHATLDESSLSYSVVDVSSREEFTAAMGAGSVDLVLSDFTLPGFDGLAALAITQQLAPHVPFVFVSGSMGEEAAIESLRNGATDYVLKHRLTRLLPAVERALQESAERRTRHLAEMALARERGFLLALLDSLEVGVVACDDQGRVTLMNRATRELHGLSSDGSAAGEWLAQSRLFAADGSTPLQEDEFPLNRALGGEVLRNLEIHICAGSGQLRAALVGGRPILDTSGNKLGAVVAVHDVTERKELERQFRQSQKMEAMGALASGVAHDFNNLLTAIMGFGQLLKARLEPDSPEMRDMAEILTAAEMAAGLTRQLLAFTRQQVLQPRVLDLNQVVTGLDKLLRRLIGEDVELRLALAADLGQVKADPGQIEQVLMNLAVNARDAMGQSGRLTIETANTELCEDSDHARIDTRPGSYVMLSVTDTGQGMSRDVMTRIFEPFFTTKEAGKGTGLGLSTVHGIVKQSGGHIEVESEPRRGTTFRIYLSRLQQAATTPSHRRAAVEAHAGDEWLLLVEDDSSIRLMLSRVLRHRGYTVLEAASGHEALALCAQPDLHIDLLVTDVVMPLMNGPDLAARITESRPEMRTLFISGYADRALAYRGVPIEQAAFLQKPFTPDALARKIREVLDVPRGEAA